MILAFLANLGLALRNPRASARWLLSRAPSPTDCALIVLLGAVLEAVFVQAAEVILLATHESAEGTTLAVFVGGEAGMSLTSMMLQLAQTAVVYAVMTAAAWAIGRRFGGRATPLQMAQAVAWYTVVAACLTPLHLLGFSAVNMETEQVSILFLLAPFAVALQIWIFAAFVAEAHGFAKLGGVVLATVAGMLALGFLGMILLSAASVPA